MDCVACRSAAVIERPERMTQGYRRFRCRGVRQVVQRLRRRGSEPHPLPSDFWTPIGGPVWALTELLVHMELLDHG
jgi:hypothetical protein